LRLFGSSGTSKVKLKLKAK